MCMILGKVAERRLNGVGASLWKSGKKEKSVVAFSIPWLLRMVGSLLTIESGDCDIVHEDQNMY